MVTPVVAVLTDPSLLDELKPQESEVDYIFHHPLEAILEPDIIAVLEPENLSAKGRVDWPYETDWHVRYTAYWFSDDVTQAVELIAHN
jgi:coenzyme A diphosphatase NUDT7